MYFIFIFHIFILPLFYGAQGGIHDAPFVLITTLWRIDCWGIDWLEITQGAGEWGFMAERGFEKH